MYGRKRYKHSSQTTHVLVCGDVGGGGVTEFFTELFHPDHGSVDRNAVVIGSGLPSADMNNLLSNPKFSFGITYLDGNVMNEKDLKRADAHHASAVFVMANKFSRTPDEEDASAILRSLAIQRPVNILREHFECAPNGV